MGADHTEALRRQRGGRLLLAACLLYTSCTEPQLVNMMVGRTLDDIYPKGNAQIGEAVLEAKHLNAGKMVQDVSFTLHRGEILGFAGLIGAGRSEVMRAIFGVDPLDLSLIHI